MLGRFLLDTDGNGGLAGIEVLAARETQNPRPLKRVRPVASRRASGRAGGRAHSESRARTRRIAAADRASYHSGGWAGAEGQSEGS